MSDKQNTLRPALLRILCAALILGATGAVLHWRQTDVPNEQYSIETVAPTCTEKGYSLYTDRTTGEVSVRDLIAEKGHSFDQWALVEQVDGVHCGFSERTCAVCGLKEPRAEYPELPISRISLYGSLDGIGKKIEVPMEAYLELKEDGLQLECYATLKYQGHVSLSYDKKNYTLKLYKDKEHQEKNKLTLSHWNKENKYILKANYVDTSQCRNLVCADVWADICAARKAVPQELLELSNYGAVDGYPVALYIDDQFSGLYNMNLHKDDDLFGMEDDAQRAIMISNHGGLPEAAFRAEAIFTEDSPWEVEFCGTQDSTWAKDSLNQLIRFVMTSDDAAFRNELHQYLDVDAAIDYLIAMYALGLTQHKVQDFVLASYGGVWIPSLYDMETAFGLMEDGTGWYEPSAFLPLQVNGVWDSGTGHLLWDRLLQNFYDEICDRYKVLRTQILDPQQLCERVTTFTNQIPAVIYDTEDMVNPHSRTYEEHKIQILRYIPACISALDQIFMKGLK